MEKIYIVRNTKTGDIVYFQTEKDAKEFLEAKELIDGDCFQFFEANKAQRIEKPKEATFVAYYSTFKNDIGVVGVLVSSEKIDKEILFPSFKNKMGRQFLFKMIINEADNKEKIFKKAKELGEKLLENEYNTNPNFKEYLHMQILESERVICKIS